MCIVRTTMSRCQVRGMRLHIQGASAFGRARRIDLGGAEGRSDHPDPKQARPQTSHPDRPDRPESNQTAQIAQTKTQAARAARRTQARPARPRSARPARFHRNRAVPIAVWNRNWILPDRNRFQVIGIKSSRWLRQIKGSLRSRMAGGTVQSEAR